MAYRSSRPKDLCFDGKYSVDKKISSGRSDVYFGFNIESGDEVAIKLESLQSRQPELANEAKIYKALGSSVGIPSVEWFGQEGDYNALVLNTLGPSLEDVLQFCGGTFSLKTTLRLAIQMIDRIEYVHSRGITHRGVKPGNFCMGIGRLGNRAYIIDFGRSKPYRDAETHEHIRYQESQKFYWNPTWASIPSHWGCEQGRRDDLESLAYVFIYFLRGSLPWQRIRDRTPLCDRFKEKKMATWTRDLCQGLPSEFGIFLDYARALRFDEEPDYAYIRKLFLGLFKREGFKMDYYDWSRHRKPEQTQTRLTLCFITKLMISSMWWAQLITIYLASNAATADLPWRFPSIA